MTLPTDAPDMPIDGLWSLLGVIVTTIIAPTIVAVVTWRTSRPAPHPTPSLSPEAEHVEQAHGISADGLDDRLLTMICRQDDRLDAIERDNAALHADLKEARWDLGTIWAWIKAGMPDPPGPGEMPPYIDLTKHQTPPE